MAGKCCKSCFEESWHLCGSCVVSGYNLWLLPVRSCYICCWRHQSSGHKKLSWIWTIWSNFTVIHIFFWRHWRDALQFLFLIVLSNRQDWAVDIFACLHISGILLWSSFVWAVLYLLPLVFQCEGHSKRKSVSAFEGRNTYKTRSYF